MHDEIEILIRSAQLRRAFALARAHGHAWALAIYDHVSDGGDAPETWDDAAAIDAAASFPGEIGGIVCPQPGDLFGTVTHETMSGRTRWSVQPDGTVTIEITRPGNRTVATATVAPDGRTALHGQDAYARHIAALAKCLAAVGEADRVVRSDDP
jgi:hypothetical protein